MPNPLLGTYGLNRFRQVCGRLGTVSMSQAGKTSISVPGNSGKFAYFPPFMPLEETQSYTDILLHLLIFDEKFGIFA